MTLKELNRMFLKAHFYMCIGTIVGFTTAHMLKIKHDFLFGIGVGLLFSLYKYFICGIMLRYEYLRLKAKNKK